MTAGGRRYFLGELPLSWFSVIHLRNWVLWNWRVCTELTLLKEVLRCTTQSVKTWRVHTIRVYISLSRLVSAIIALTDVQMYNCQFDRQADFCKVDTDGIVRTCNSWSSHVNFPYEILHISISLQIRSTIIWAEKTKMLNGLWLEIFERNNSNLENADEYVASGRKSLRQELEFQCVSKIVQSWIQFFPSRYVFILEIGILVR